MKTPCVWKSVLSAVATSPSGPPSKTFTFPISQTARSPVLAEPGTRLLAVVLIVHVAPVAVLAVAEHGMVNGKVVSEPVAGVVAVGSLNRSVIRRS